MPARGHLCMLLVLLLGSTAASSGLFGVSRIIVITVPQRLGEANLTDLARVFGAPASVQLAVTPETLSRDELPLQTLYEIVYGRTSNYAATGLGQIACYKSHIEALRRVSPNETVLIAEDDVITGAGLDALLPTFIAADAFMYNHIFDVLRLNELDGNYTEYPLLRGLSMQKCAGRCMGFGTTAYVVTYRGAQKLLGMSRQGLGLQIDYFMDMVRIFNPNFIMWGVGGLRMGAERPAETDIKHEPCVRCSLPTDVEMNDGRASVFGAIMSFVWAVGEHVTSHNHRKKSAAEALAAIMAMNATSSRSPGSFP